MKTEVADSP